MAIKFPSDAWIQALRDELNRSQNYREAARNWEGDFYFVVSGQAGTPDVSMYMDLWHGECRVAEVAADPQARNPEFVIEAPLATWRKVLERRLDPIQALVTRQLRLKGQLLKVMRAPRAATELVHCCTLIETEWPNEDVVLSQP
jgi:putative sterol carrier protein